MILVPFGIEDSKEVARFFREIFKELGFEERESDHMDQPHLLFHLPDGGALLLAKEEGRVIGTAGIIRLDSVEGLMKRFYIRKDYRGSGIAKKLLDEILKAAKKMGLSRIVIDVSINNKRALRFYEKNKFVKYHPAPIPIWPESFEPETHNFYFINLQIYLSDKSNPAANARGQ